MFRSWTEDSDRDPDRDSDRDLDSDRDSDSEAKSGFGYIATDTIRPDKRRLKPATCDPQQTSWRHRKTFGDDLSIG